jgi:hypothetical protein
MPEKLKTITRKVYELDNERRMYNKTDKAWYVPYRLISREVDNYKSYIDPAGCQNIIGRTFTNIGVDTSHNQFETAGTVVDMYNTIDDRVGVTLDIVMRFGEDDYLTDKKGNQIKKGLKGEEIRSSAHAYELGYIKGVSIDLYAIEKYITDTNREGWRSYSVNRVAVLTKLTADIPGQGMSGELEGAEFRKLDTNPKNNIEYNYMTIRCLCDSSVGAFGRSTLDNQYVELLKVEGEGEDKTFTLRNVLTNDEFTTKFDDHFNEISEDDVATRINEILNADDTTRKLEDNLSELRACTACQAKMTARKNELLKKQKEMSTKRFWVDQVVVQKSTDKLGKVTKITDTEESQTATIEMEGVESDYVYNKDADSDTLEYETADLVDLYDKITGAKPDPENPVIGDPVAGTRDLPVDGSTGGENPEDVAKKAVDTEMLKSEIESIKSTLDTLVSDVEVLKSATTRTTDEEAETARIEDKLTRMFSPIQQEIKKFSPNLDNDNEIRNLNEELKSIEF